MRCFFDTSILLPAALTAHPNHNRAFGLLRQVAQEGVKASNLLCLSTHVIAEMYATFPNVARQLSIEVTPPQVLAEIKAVTRHLNTVDLSEADYFTALERCVDLELSGAVIYDALHFQAALKAKADILYTENRRDFDRLLRADELVIRSLPD